LADIPALAQMIVASLTGFDNPAWTGSEKPPSSYPRSPLGYVLHLNLLVEEVVYVNSLSSRGKSRGKAEEKVGASSSILSFCAPYPYSWWPVQTARQKAVGS